MALKFYNTLSRSLEPFEPLTEGRVGLYACGPTVYQLPHIGNYRTFLFNDVLHRYLEWKGYQVRFVMNLTDVDDKIIARAAEAGVSIQEYVKPFVDGFLEELRGLGVRDADVYPRATDHIPDMTALVERLMENGHAYRTEDGSVFYDVGSFDRYGRLSRIPLDEVRQGERVASDEYEKGDARDFALWKGVKPADREVGAVWDAPWGAGRPGWHLECSAMSMAELGETFDIHTGGEDLVFPHHEDEIAQSEGATGKPFVRYWLHARHLMMDTEKMSKSLGNVVRISDVYEQGYSPAVVRYLLLSAHYRKELRFSWDALDDARSALRRILDFRDRLESATAVDGSRPAGDAAAGDALEEIADRALAAFEAALDDDLNVPAALGALFTFIRETNTALDEGARSTTGLARARDALASMDDVLGLIALADSEPGPDEELAEWVNGKLEERQQARADRDFARADAIRDELAAAGVVVEDTPQGARWKLADG
ncbi:MAG TPA: cysteine--tRNA ligase [Longimicrobiales bacterium]|nr:cysteine--tRNA ligase [Longimicrobiales bacterium]